MGASLPGGSTPGRALSQPRWEVADVFRLYGDGYRSTHVLPPHPLRVMADIETCRTAALGGHIEACDACGFERPVYNSCGNRHCPKCQTRRKAQWLEARRAEQLPVGYFHVVFTWPHRLNGMARWNKRLVYNLIFEQVAETLKAFGRDHLGGEVGFTSLLHTWDQTLGYHVHLHCVIPAGALDPAGKRWHSARENYLFPVKALSRVFRGKCADALRRAAGQGKLRWPPELSSLGTGRVLCRLLRQARRKHWVVYCKKPFGGPAQVLDYLSRYTHRVALSNDRILDVREGRVRFHYRDRTHGDRLEIMDLQAHDFIDRFLDHVLPPGFMRIRHFGFLANRCKHHQLPLCRALLGQWPPVPKPAHKTLQEWMYACTGQDLTRCPRCGQGTMGVVRCVPRPSRGRLPRASPELLVWDSL